MYARASVRVNLLTDLSLLITEEKVKSNDIFQYFWGDFLIMSNLDLIRSNAGMYFLNNLQSAL